MIDDYYDEEGNISIFKVARGSGDISRAPDPATRELRNRLFYKRLEQMRHEVEENMRLLNGPITPPVPPKKRQSLKR